MKNNILIAGILLGSQLAFAHADHAPKIASCASKECTKSEVEAAVPSAVEKLVKAGKIDGAWTTAKVEKVEHKTFKKGPEWVATLIDEKQKDQAKQRLYIFITTKGALNGANTTGQ